MNDFVKISRYAGQRFDLVQAAGGNSSVKLNNGQMLIKASGYHLSEITEKTGFSVVDNSMVLEILSNEEIVDCKIKKNRELKTKKLIDSATITKEVRPSIETLLHSLLKKYTLHTHSIAANIILASEHWREDIYELFDEKICVVDYRTPGIDLAIELKKQIKFKKVIPEIIFLQNHGLIITSDDPNKLLEINEFVLSKIEKNMCLDFSKFKLTTKISKFISSSMQKDVTVFLSNDSIVSSFLSSSYKLESLKPFNPDSLVYFGFEIIKLNNLIDSSPLIIYENKYRELPKVFIFKKNIYISADNFKKFKEIEDVLKSHLLIILNCKKPLNYLKFDELKYLSNWEAEKFRNKL